MSRKHFRELARIISLLKDEEARTIMAVEVGRMCQRENGNFNKNKWFAVCNVTTVRE